MTSRELPPPGDGPYRTSARGRRIRRAWIPWMVGGAAALLAVLVGVLSWDEAPPDRPALSTVPVGLWEHVAAWPPPEEALPPSTPLAPLLVADQPDALAVMTPREGATSLRRGQSLTVRFNRPMV
ncbi:MAG: hypothetical protein RID93_25510, partial [Sandaracinaceae bacterium]